MGRSLHHGGTGEAEEEETTAEVCSRGPLKHKAKVLRHRESGRAASGKKRPTALEQEHGDYRQCTFAGAAVRAPCVGGGGSGAGSGGGSWGCPDTGGRKKRIASLNHLESQTLTALISLRDSPPPSPPATAATTAVYAAEAAAATAWLGGGGEGGGSEATAAAALYWYHQRVVNGGAAASLPPSALPACPEHYQHYLREHYQHHVLEHPPRPLPPMHEKQHQRPSPGYFYQHQLHQHQVAHQLQMFLLARHPPPPPHHLHERLQGAPLPKAAPSVLAP